MTECNFKVGDKVRRKDTKDTKDTYEVEHISFDGFAYWLRFKTGGGGWLLEYYYELVEPAQEPKSSDVVFITTAEYEGLRNRIAELEEALKNEKISLKVKEAEEWISWAGGKYPVDPETRVDVKFKDSVIAENIQAYDWYWEHTNSHYDIIAYRIAK